MTTVSQDAVKETLRRTRLSFPSKFRITWNPSPKIGWWADKPVVTFYHGTHYSKLESILKTALYAPKTGPTANWVSLALEPNTAFAYASMNGESSFRAAGASAKSIPPNERVVLVLRLSMQYILKNMEKNFRGNIQETRTKLEDKTEYNAWKKSDQEYYALTELRFPRSVDSRYIIGYTVKK